MRERCGRATKSGAPCRALIWDPWSVACPLHATDQDRAVADARRTGWLDGFKAGRRSAEPLEARAPQPQPQQRTATADGRQIVEVGGYAYCWSGVPLRVGDDVVLPGNWLYPRKRQGTVTALGSTYDGEIAEILEVAS